MAAKTLPPAADHWAGPNLALANAAARGDAGAIKAALDEGADPNALSAQGMPMILWPVLAGNYDGFTALLDEGANPEARFPAAPGERDPSGIATEMMVPLEDQRFLDEALRRGASPDAVGSNTEPLIWKAYFADRWHVAQKLIESGANVDAANHGEPGATLLSSYSSGAFDKVVWLLEQGADPSYPITAAPKGYEDRIGAMPILENIYYFDIDAEAFPQGAADQKRAQEIVAAMGHPKPPRPKRYQ